MDRDGKRHEEKKLYCLLFAACFVALGVFRRRRSKRAKISRVGYGSTWAIPDANFAELRQGLRDLGYVEGKNIVLCIARLKATPNGFRLAAELVRLKVDLLVWAELPAIHAAKEATRTIPIVMISNVRPGRAGTRRKLCAARRKYYRDDFAVAGAERETIGTPQGNLSEA